MISREHCHDLFERIRKHTQADDVEVTISGGRNALTRFANNTILQNVSEEDYDVSVRVQLGGRTARASTNKFDDDSLRQVAQRAEALARVQDEDPELLPMLSGPEVSGKCDVDRYCAETASIDAGRRAQEVGNMVEVARKLKLNSAGIYASGESVEALFNSRGVAAYHCESHAETSVTMQATDSSGWQKQNAVRASDFDAQQLAEIAARKAMDSAKPVELEPGKYTVILEPSAVVDVVGYLFWDFSGQALLDQRSFLNDRLGKQVFGGNICISDDVFHPAQSGAAFDGEGVPRRRLCLVENGIPRQIALARGTAERIRHSELVTHVQATKATGHGFALPNESGEAPTNIVFQVPEGVKTKSVDEMVAATERGILVTRLWYIREVDPYEKILTGMTRDGTFLVENGKVQRGIYNFRFNQSVVRMLNNVVDMGVPVRACGEEAFDMVAAAMRVTDFNFSEVTRF